jgi:hypothetical protein
MALAVQIVPHRAAFPAAMMIRPRTRRLQRLGRFGALTPDQAAQQAMPTSTISSRAGFTQTVYNDILQAAQNGNFVAFNPTGCTGIQPSGAQLALVGASAGSSAAKLALTLAGVAGPAGLIVAGIGAAINIFGALFSHHAQAVALEQKTVCAAVPAASDSITAITQAVQNGTVPPQTGIQMLQNLQAQFSQQVAPIIKNNSSQCNAACVWVKMLQAIVAELSSQFQDMANAQQAQAQSQAAAAQQAQSNPAAVASNPVAAVQNTVNTTAAQIGVPSWTLYAAAGLLLFLVVSK